MYIINNSSFTYKFNLWLYTRSIGGSRVTRTSESGAGKACVCYNYGSPVSRCSRKKVKSSLKNGAVYRSTCTDCYQYPLPKANKKAEKRKGEDKSITPSEKKKKKKKKKS